MKTLIFKVDGIEHEIELDQSHAPETLYKVLSCLPREVDIHCAKVAGSHIMWPMPMLAKIEKSSDVLTMPPGAFFFWPERQYLEISYDELQAETAQISYLGKLKGDVDWLREFADRNRQEQGQKIFRASLFVKDQKSPSAPMVISKGKASWERLQKARLAVWQSQPDDVTELLQRRGLNIPFGPLSMAEGESRKLHELLWRLWNGNEHYDDENKKMIAVFVMEAAISRMAGFCHMQEVGNTLNHGILALQENDLEINLVLEELILYIGRIAAWLDLHICWWPMNEITRSAIEGRPLNTNLD